MVRRRLPAAAAALAAGLAGQICLARTCAAQDLFSPDTVHGLVELRAATAGGERSWTDGGFGKTPVSGHHAKAEVSQAVLEWRPRFSFAASAVVSGQYQADGVHPRFDLDEAYLKLRSPPSRAGRISARAGLFYPPISLEHDGVGWTSTDLLSASAVNSWIGEEVKVVGLEGTATHPLAGGRLSGTFGLFGFNDTSGTLLAFRGWALHDQKTGAFSRQTLPLLNGDMTGAQPPWTTPTLEVDERIGFYGRLAYQFVAPVTLEAFYYDNRGDPMAFTDDLQWGWRTRFLNVGARVDFSPRTRLLAQAMTGSTQMGQDMPEEEFWVDTRFRAAFVRLTHEVGPVALSARLDLFDTRQRGEYVYADDDEEGWSLTGAVDWRLTDQARVIVEGLHVESERGARLRLGVAPRQAQDVVQASMRITL